MPRRPSWFPDVRKLAVVLLVGLLTALPATPDAVGWVHRLGLDLLLPLSRALPEQGPAPEVPVFVVAVTEAAYATPPFSGRPQVAWTPMLAEVLGKIDRAGATVVGLDVVYPTTLDQPDLVPGYDRPLLGALRDLAARDALVMGMVRLSARAIEPERRQQIVAGGPRNIRPLNLVLDEDEVVRRYPAVFATADGGTLTSFGTELARRAGAAVPAADFAIDFRHAAGAVRSVSLAALHACADEAAFARFKGAVVLVGTELDVEDRVVAANRLAADRPPPEGCTEAAAEGEVPPLVDRRSIPGVHVHAAAIRTMLDASAPTVVAGAAAGGTVGLWAMAAAALFMRLRPSYGGAALLGGTAALVAAAVVLFAQASVVLPLVAMTAATVFAYAAVYAFRFVTEDRVRRRIAHAFKHYLAPELVDRLAEGAQELKLGGHRQEVTVFFSDIAGFTNLSESLADEPEKLVEVINAYLACMTEVIQAHGGYVDKYIGDAIMAVWNAPLPDPQAEENAVRCALACLRALDRFNAEVVVGRYGRDPIGTRIGINSGLAIVGNMGGASRLNYTVIGDPVNLAARLEGANKTFGTRLMIGESTASRLGAGFVLRRLDRLVVKGKTRPVTVYEPLDGRPDAAARADRFHAALAAYDAQRFAAALAGFEALAAEDSAAAAYVERCRHYLAEPPGEGWDGAYTLTSK